MATKAEGRMNLSALQQRDPYITDIVDTASQVALYSFSSKNNEWEKTDVEGTLFVYTRSASPINGFMILNRLGLHDLIEPINKNLEFQLQDPFLLYRTDRAIYGIWFYDKDECARIGQLMNSLVQIALENQEQKEVLQSRQRRASESDTMPERAEKIPRPAAAAKNVDIIKMLSKAQDEYDKAKAGPSTSQRVEPKPMIDNPNASATQTGSNLIKPLALKVVPTDEEEDTDLGQAAGAMMVSGMGAVGGVDMDTSTPNTHISLDALFRRASMQQQQQQPQPTPGVDGQATGGGGAVPKTYHRSQSLLDTSHCLPSSSSSSATSTAATSSSSSSTMPALLQRMMSNPGTTVEELERQHRGDIPRDQMPQPAGAEAPTEAPLTIPAPTRMVSGAPKPSTTPLWSSGQQGSTGGACGGSETQSPDTVLKRSLNILPPRTTSSSTAATTGALFSGAAAAASSSSSSSSSSLPLEQHTLMEEGCAPLGGAGEVFGGGGGGGGLARTVSAHDYLTSHPHHPANMDAGSLVQRLAAMATGTPPTSGSLPSMAQPGLLRGGSGTTHPVPIPCTHSSSALPTSELVATGGVLLTPMSFEMSPRVTPTHSLPPPSVFQAPVGVYDGGRVSQASPLLAGAVGGLTAGTATGGGCAETPEISPLTREQLQQALLFLIRTDGDFMKSIHDAYVRSLTSGLASSHHKS